MSSRSCSCWILNVLERGILDLDLRLTLFCDDTMHSSIFVSKSLVRLRLESEIKNVDVVQVEDVFLPNVKTLHLNFIVFGEDCNCSLGKVVSGCPVLEELVLLEVSWNDYWNRSVSSKTLKRLTLHCQYLDTSPDSVSFDTPNLVYFDYADHVANKYEIVNFETLVEASINLRMTRDQDLHASDGDIVCNVTDLFMGINNVQILNLSSTTLEVLAFCRDQILVFKNLIHLNIQTDWNLGWDSLPALLKNCPNLETLVFQGLHHKNTMKCEEVDGCLCKSSRKIPSFLSSSPVKAIKILNFGDFFFFCNDIDKQMEQVKYFLETMPNLEEMIVSYDTRIDEGLKSQLDRLTHSGSSSKCRVQLICDNLRKPANPFSFKVYQPPPIDEYLESLNLF